MDFPDFAEIKAYDLGQPYFTGMPHFQTHPPFLYSLTKKHGDMIYAEGTTAAADAIAVGTHVGSRIKILFVERSIYSTTPSGGFRNHAGASKPSLKGGNLQG